MLIRDMMTLKFFIMLAGFFPCFIFVALVLKSSVYLLLEFKIISNNGHNSEFCNSLEFRQHIPSTIHQIFGFKDSKMKMEYENKRQVWIKTHRNFTIHLWNETAVTNLIKREYGYIYRLFQSYSSWVQRADVARYVILYHHGGWYVDIDISCKNGLHEISEEAYKLKKHVILRKTLPDGPSNDLFGVTPRHPFLKSVLDNLQNANRWFVIPHWNILLSTGSTYMFGRYINYPCKDDVIMLEKERYEQYFQIEHHGSWHSWDTGTINFFFALVLTHKRLCVSIALFVLLIVALSLLRGFSFTRRMKN